MSNAKTKKSRRSLILLLSAFLVPVILAKLALHNEWFNYGVTNQGQLLSPPLSLQDINIEQLVEKQWLMLYTVPQDCNKRCIETLKGIENTYFALGRETPRVTPIALSNSPFNAEQLKELNAQHWQIKTAPEVALKKLKPQTLYIADPLGNIVLQYKSPSSSDDIPSFGRAMLNDLKKLLKYSRIG